MKKNKGRQIDKKTSKQVRIDSELHKILKIEAAEQEVTIKELVEWCLVNDEDIKRSLVETNKGGD